MLLVRSHKASRPISKPLLANPFTYVLGSAASLRVFSRRFRLGVYYKTKKESVAMPVREESTAVLYKQQSQPESLVVPQQRNSHWGKVEMGPPDVILGIQEAFKRDKHPKKVNLGVGAYKDDNGRPWVLPSVRRAEEIILCQELNHEYAPIAGNAEFCKLAKKLAFGDCCEAVNNKSTCTVQTISGTGALRLGLEFIIKYYTKNKVIYMSNPTWGNHPQICDRLVLKHEKYRYFDIKTNGLDLNGCLEDICKMPEGSIIMIHACAHNPTGVDPNEDEWRQISETVKQRKLLPFFDMAYQGFATGDVNRDAAAIRLFADSGHQLLLAQSFSKNMGLYGERVGALTVFCGDEKIAAKVMSQLKILIRVMYSNPPLYGARIASTILGNKELHEEWLSEMKQMSSRISSMRKELRADIEATGSKKNWKHVTKQIGMFCYTGLKPDQVEKMTKDFHIYMTKDGRINLAGITSKNVDYVAEAFHKVTS